MNISKFILIIIVAISGALACEASQSTLKWKPTSTDTVLNKANMQPSISSPYGEIFNDPVVNSAIGGYSNMVQGETGGSFNPVEQQKMQVDYTRQQCQNENDE